MMTSDTKIPLWLDCDPGHDDVFAILFAAYHPALNLLGISTVFGNAPLSHTTENAGRALTAIGKPHTPVYAGAADGMIRPAAHAGSIHGESGLDGTFLLPEPLVPAILDESAIAAMGKALRATPHGSAWVVATGALTNVAQMFIAYPDIVEHIKGLSIMGGAIGGGFTDAQMGKVGSEERFGNWTPYAEFNIVIDPEAAASIFTNPKLANKTTLIPLDVTHQVLATTSVQSLLLHGPSLHPPNSNRSPSTLRRMLIELLNFFAKTYADVFGITAGPPLHDPLAVAVILDGILGHEIPFYENGPGMETDVKERFHVEVVTAGTHAEAMAGKTQTGRTIVKLLEDGQPGVKIPRDLDVDRFWRVMEECIALADEAMGTA